MDVDVLPSLQLLRREVEDRLAKTSIATTETSHGGIVSSAAETENWRVPIQLTVNGVEHAATVEPRTLLVYFLRDDLSLTGTHVGCDTSQCGA
jgi:hypothetical protein